MRHEFAPAHLDLRAFAHSSGRLVGSDAVARYERIAHECQGRGLGRHVQWSARGETRADPLGQECIWLHLDVDTTVPLTCQRCLSVVEVRLLVDRWFRFVVDEETAAAQDDDVPEDLLVLAGDFDLHQLIEDELVLELPLIARHETCPTQPAFTAQDAGFGAPSADRPNPFAVLGRLRSTKRGQAK